MPKVDYSDDDDYYSQGFERKGVVSVWGGRKIVVEELDTLQDLCGVGYYRLDDQESNSKNLDEVELAILLSDLSYSASFADKALQAAESIGFDKARWVTVQYDFAYDETKVTRTVADDPVFLGVFHYDKSV